MSTLNQSSSRLFQRRRHSKAAALRANPQRQGDVFRPLVVTPKKPNSARRPVAKVLLTTKRHAIAHVPGSGHNLRRHSDVLVRGGGARDLPGVCHTCIRGVYDLSPMSSKTRRRSVYGVKRPEHLVKKLRRKFRASSA